MDHPIHTLANFFSGSHLPGAWDSRSYSFCHIITPWLTHVAYLRTFIQTPAVSSLKLYPIFGFFHFLLLSSWYIS